MCAATLRTHREGHGRNTHEAHAADLLEHDSARLSSSPMRRPHTRAVTVRVTRSRNKQAGMPGKSSDTAGGRARGWRQPLQCPALEHFQPPYISSQGVFSYLYT